MDARMCVECKGTKSLCGKPACPKLEKARALQRLKGTVARDIDGYTPSVFVGSYGYPRVLAGPLVSPELVGIDTPENMYGTPLEDIAAQRFMLVRSKEPISIHATSPSKDLQALQDMAMSVKSVETEVEFKHAPRFDFSWAQSATPYGTSADIERMAITSNPSIPGRIDKVVSDELKAADQLYALFDNSTPVSQLSRILSVGLLGQQKKLVPTRWSITATDDTLGKRLIDEVKEFEESDGYSLFTSTYLGNHFEVLLTPGAWSFENLEAWLPGNIWTEGASDVVFMQDWEPYEGRTTYASNITGAYYAVRLAVLEKLREMKRQATAIVVREITPDYWMPVGVWECRENVRAAVRGNVARFQSLAELLEEVRKRNITKGTWEKKSELLARIRSRDAFRQYLK
jgi:hypothetical protein